MLSNTDILILLLATLLFSTLSGLAGGGGGFISTPLMIYLGLSPAQSIATGKIGGLSVAIGSLGGLRGVRVRSRRLVFMCMAIALIIGLLAPFVITNLDSTIYRRALGVLLLAMIPLVIYKKLGTELSVTTRKKKIFGILPLTISYGIQAVFSSGMGTLVNLSLMNFMGLSANEANVTKRLSQLVLNITVSVGLIFSGLIYWRLAVPNLFVAFAGGYIGGKIASKRGNKFVMLIFVAMMLIAALEMLFS